MEKSRKPKIRFKGFTDDWEQRELGEVAKYRNGKAHENDISEHGEYVVVNSKFVSTDGEVCKFSNKQIEPLYKDEIAFVLSDVPNGRAIARTFLVDKNDKYTLNQRIAGITPAENVCPYFLHILMNRNIYFLQFDDGAKQTNLSITDVMEFEEYYPSNEEQNRIGRYFENLDRLITLHQRKLEKLMNVKKSMLEKMFPKQGSKVPEIRFNGFTDDWEQRKLIDICEYVDYRGKTPLKTDHGIFLVTAKNIKFGYIDYESSKEYILEEDYEEVMRRGKPEIGDVLITTEAPCGNIAQVNICDIALAQRIIKYRGRKNVIDNTYLKHYMLSSYFQMNLQEKISGGTVKGIKGSILHQQYISFPKFDEQIKIGQYFDDLDHLITLHQRKLEKLKNIKKSMLEKMFI